MTTKQYIKIDGIYAENVTSEGETTSVFPAIGLGVKGNFEIHITNPEALASATAWLFAIGQDFNPATTILFERAATYSNGVFTVPEMEETRTGEMVAWMGANEVGEAVGELMGWNGGGVLDKNHPDVLIQWRLFIRNRVDQSRIPVPEYGEVYVTTDMLNETVGNYMPVSGGQFTGDIYRKQGSDSWKYITASGGVFDGNIYKEVQDEDHRYITVDDADEILAGYMEVSGGAFTGNIYANSVSQDNKYITSAEANARASSVITYDVNNLPYEEVNATNAGIPIPEGKRIAKVVVVSNNYTFLGGSFTDAQTGKARAFEIELTVPGEVNWNAVNWANEKPYSPLDGQTHTYYIAGRLENGQAVYNCWNIV